MLCRRGWRRLELRLRRWWTAMLIRTIETLTLRGRELLGRCVMLSVLAVWPMLLLLEELLRLLLVRLRGRLLEGYRSSLGYSLSRLLRYVRLLVRPCLRLIWAVLGLRLGRRRRRLDNRGRRLEVLMLLRLLRLLLTLLLLPVRAIAVVRIELGLISRASGGSSRCLLSGL